MLLLRLHELGTLTTAFVSAVAKSVPSKSSSSRPGLTLGQRRAVHPARCLRPARQRRRGLPARNAPPVPRLAPPVPGRAPPSRDGHPRPALVARRGIEGEGARRSCRPSGGGRPHRGSQPGRFNLSSLTLCHRERRIWRYRRSSRLGSRTASASPTSNSYPSPPRRLPDLQAPSRPRRSPRRPSPPSAPSPRPPR